MPDDEGRKKGKAVCRILKLKDPGRIPVSIEIHKTQSTLEDGTLEIRVVGNEVVLRKSILACMYCKATKDVRIDSGTPICRKCLAGTHFTK